MLPGKTYTLEEVVRILRRGGRLVLLLLALGTAVGIVGYQWLPVQYQSETLIMTMPQRIPDSDVKSTVTTNIEDRLRSIHEQILSRSRLERIIHDFDLYKEQRTAGIMGDVVQGMRGDIDVKLGGRPSSFRVTYVSPDPKIAQKVTERLAALYIAENARDGENLVADASRFLESQLQDRKQRLIEQEKKLEAYRDRYGRQLPSQLHGNLRALESAQIHVQSLGESMNHARERRMLVERQTADAETISVDAVLPGIAVASPEAPAPVPAAQQLEAARARLDVFKARYSQDHPDVLALEQTIRDLQARGEEEARRPSEPTQDKPLSPSKVVRQRRLRELQAELKVIDLQLAASQAEAARLKTTMADYHARIDVVPTRESELVELTRDYRTLQETYSNLLLKRDDSTLAANLERRQIGEQFRILDPASLQERPHNQKQRLEVLVGGAVGGLALGLLLVGFLEYRDSTFTCEDDVHRVLSLPVLALIPVMESERGGPVRRRRLACGLSAVLLIAGSAAALVVWRLQP